MGSDIAADISLHQAAQEDMIGGSARATPLEATGQAKQVVANTSGGAEKETEEVEAENIGKPSEGERVLPTASESNSASIAGTEEIIDDRILTTSTTGEEKGGCASGETTKITSTIAEATSIADNSTEQINTKSAGLERAEDSEQAVSEVEATEIARKAARRLWIQDQIDLAEADIAEQRKGIEELEEARVMMEKNFQEEIAAVEAKERELMARLSKIYEKAERAQKAKEGNNEVEVQEAREEAGGS